MLVIIKDYVCIMNSMFKSSHCDALRCERVSSGMFDCKCS
jgi:hypothetical protein